MADQKASKEKKGTNAVVRQGHTSGLYGNDPGVSQKGDEKPKDLKA